MAAAAGTVAIKILGDATDLKRTFDTAGGDTDRFGKKMGGLGKIIGGALAGGALLSFGKAAVSAFTESEQAQSKLELALKNSSATVGVHASEFAKLNTELAKHTLADDDVIAATEAQMVTFGASKSQIESMIPVVLDFAAKMGIDGPAAADLFDKASLGSVKALKTLGIEGYKPTGDKANDLANIQGLLREKVAGAAQAQLDAASPAEKFNKSMDELKETVGAKLVPALQKAAELGIAVTDWLSKHPEAILMAGALGTLAGAVWTINTATAAWRATQALLNAEVLTFNAHLLITAGRLAAILGPLAVVIGGMATIKKDVEATEGSNWNKAIHGLLGNSPVSDFLGGGSPSPSKFIGPVLPKAAGGAINGLALVGERGPELFAGRGTIIPNHALGGGTVINVTVNVDGSVITERDLGRVIADQLRNNTLLGVT